jgi:hypothetical protein
MIILVTFGDSILVEEAIELKKLVKHASTLVRVDGVLGFDFFDVENHFIFFLLLEVSGCDS